MTTEPTAPVDPRGAPQYPERLTPEMLEACISGCYFFTFGKGTEDIPAWHKEAIGVVTICLMVLHNGFVVVGKSACVTPALFDAEIGRKVAREDAISQMWALEGYQLKTLHSAEAMNQRISEAFADTQPIA